MTQEEIIENNRLIAKFMGGKEEYDAPVGWIKSVYGLPNNQDRFELIMGKYHSSWDWLMPAVEKTREICAKNGFELSNHSAEQEHLLDQLNNPSHWRSWSYHTVNLSTDIKKVWNATVDFIKWYNKNNSINS